MNRLVNWWYRDQGGEDDVGPVVRTLSEIDHAVRMLSDSNVGPEEMLAQLSTFRAKFEGIAVSTPDEIRMKNRLGESLDNAENFAQHMNFVMNEIPPERKNRDAVLHAIGTELKRIEDETLVSGDDIQRHKAKLDEFRQELKENGGSVKDRELLSHIVEIEALLDTLAISSATAPARAEGKCRTIYASANQYAAARNAGIQGNLNATCASQAAAAIAALSPLIGTGDIRSNTLDELMRGAVIRHQAAVTRLGKTNQDNLTMEDIRRGGQFPELEFGEELDPETPPTANDMEQYYSIYILGLLQARARTDPNKVSSLMLIKGPEASAMFYKTGGSAQAPGGLVQSNRDQGGLMQSDRQTGGLMQSPGGFFYHFDSHGFQGSNNNAYLQCFPTPQAMLNYLTRRYPFVDDNGQGYNSFEIREVWRR